MTLLLMPIQDAFRDTILRERLLPPPFFAYAYRCDTLWRDDMLMRLFTETMRAAMRATR